MLHDANTDTMGPAPQLLEYGPGATESKTYPLRRMKQRHYELLFAILSGLSLADAANAIQMSYNGARMVYNSEVFQENLKSQRQHLANQIAQGKHGARAIFLHNAEEMASMLVNMARSARSEQVRYACAKDILDRAGLAPAKETHVLNLNELLEQMTDGELDHYVAHGEWPSRLRDKASALLEARRTIDISPRDD